MTVLRTQLIREAEASARLDGETFPLDLRPQAALFDIDGTLAQIDHTKEDPRGWYDWHRVGEDLPLEPWVDLARRLKMTGLDLVYLTGRPDQCRAQTLDWIERWVEPRQFGSIRQMNRESRLWTRADDDFRPGPEYKIDVLRNWIEPRWRIAFAVDDQPDCVQAFRDHGIPCLAVSPSADPQGSPDPFDRTEMT